MAITTVIHKFVTNLAKRAQTKYIVCHHRAGTGDVESIHRQHLNIGYSGIGYHYYIRKDGSIFTGRPVDTVGAHCKGNNANSVGICFEGNFENDVMSDVQLKSGQYLINYLKQLYPKATVVRHKDLYATACPGAKFPFDKLKNAKVTLKQELTSGNDIAWELTQKVKIHDVDGLVKAIDKAKAENSPLYWVLYKLVNL